MTKELMQQAHKLGFIRGVQWSGCSDLIDDTEGFVYLSERDDDIAAIAQPEQPVMSDATSSHPARKIKTIAASEQIIQDSK